jgi:hypothetical protein
MVVVCHAKNGLAEFGFSIEFQPDIGWRVYIVFDPFRRGRDHPLDLPYQSIDNAGRRYVDWSPKIDTLDEAKTVARIWAELAQRDQRAQEERALYIELIQHHLSTGKQKRTTPTSPASPDAAVNTGKAGSADQHRAPITPQARAPAQALSSPQQRQRTVA